MKIKNWMTIKVHEVTPKKKAIAEFIGREDIVGRYYPNKKVKSFKRARKNHKTCEIGTKGRWSTQKSNKRYLNDLYTYLRPGYKVNTCNAGNILVTTVEIHMDQYGNIEEIAIQGPDPKFASCDWNHCVSPGWMEYLKDDKGNVVGYQYEGHPKVFYKDEMTQ